MRAVVTIALLLLARPALADHRVVYFDDGVKGWKVASSHASHDEAFAAAVDLINRGRTGAVRDVHVAGEPAEERARLAAAIDGNDFFVDRNAAGYQDYLGPAFAADRSGWTKGMRILDAGAGSAVMFQELIAERGGVDLPDLVAVSVRRPAGNGDLHGVDYREGTLGAGRAFERHLGTFDRVVDVFGASHYSPDLDRIIDSYGRLLRPGGRAYLHLAPWDLAIRSRRGQPIDALSWLGRVKGMRVIYAAPNGVDGIAVVLERTRGRLAVPRLELVDSHDSLRGPPVRSYISRAGRPNRFLRWWQRTQVERRTRRLVRRERLDRISPVADGAPRRGLNTRTRARRVR